MSAKKRKHVSYEDYYERKYRGSKKIWLLVALLLIVTAAVLTVGYQRSNERQQQLQQEAEQYNTDEN